MRSSALWLAASLRSKCNAKEVLCLCLDGLSIEFPKCLQVHRRDIVTGARSLFIAGWSNLVRHSRPVDGADAMLDASLSLGIYKLFHILNFAATKKVLFFFFLQWYVLSSSRCSSIWVNTVTMYNAVQRSLIGFRQQRGWLQKKRWLVFAARFEFSVKVFFFFSDCRWSREGCAPSRARWVTSCRSWRRFPPRGRWRPRFSAVSS